MGQDVFQKVPTDSGHRFFPSPNGAVPIRVSAVAVGPSSPSAPGTPPPGATSLSGPSSRLAQYECRAVPLAGTMLNGPSPECLGVGVGFLHHFEVVPAQFLGRGVESLRRDVDLEVVGTMLGTVVQVDGEVLGHGSGLPRTHRVEGVVTPTFGVTTAAQGPVRD